MRYLDRYLRVRIKNLSDDKFSVFDESWKITFRIRKFASATIFSYNTMEMSIYNMNSETRANLSGKELPIVVEAGYKDNESLRGIIFDGVINNITTTKRGTDIITTFYCSSDIRNFDAPISVNFQNISVVQAIRQLCNDAKVSYYLPNDLDKGIITNMSYVGIFEKVIGLICWQYGIYWGLDNGSIIFGDKLKKEKDTTKENIKVFTPSNGLLGSPTVLQTGIRINSLMQPQIRVNDYFKLDAPFADYNLGNLTNSPNLVTNNELNSFSHIDTKDYNGVYRALSITHSGDTRGNEWKTEFDGIRLKNIY